MAIAQRGHLVGQVIQQIQPGRRLEIARATKPGLVEALRVMVKRAHGPSLGTRVATRKRVLRIALHRDNAIVS